MGKIFPESKERLSKTAQYKTDVHAQKLLHEMNTALQPLELETISKLGNFSSMPVLFISYLPRSGSTLLSQLLIQTGKFNYISNFQSRFWQAPYLGAVLEKTLFNKFGQEMTFSSDYGLTRQWHEPSEFTYFWEYWLKLSDKKNHVLSERDAVKIKWNLLKKEINALRSLTPRPLLFKKEWLGMNAGFLLEKIPNVRFIYLERNSFDLAVSILKARQEVFGNLKSWWAAKPSNFHKISKLDSYRQIAAQIAGIRKDIEKSVELHPEKFLCLKYEGLISDIHSHVKKIGAFAGIKITNSDLKKLPERVTRGRSRQPANVNKEKIMDALKEFGLNG